jgi:hypothetical protein
MKRQPEFGPGIRCKPRSSRSKGNRRSVHAKPDGNNENFNRCHMSFYLYSRQTTAIYKKISNNANVKTLPDAGNSKIVDLHCRIV